MKTSARCDAVLIPAWLGEECLPLEKLEVHRLGLKHKAVSVFVMDGNAVLLQRRALSKYHTPGLWTNTCCTHPHWGENSHDCAVRRLQDELGIIGLDLQLRAQIEYRVAVSDDMIEHEVVDVFLAETKRTVQVQPDLSEVMDIAWINLPQLIENLRHWPHCFTPWFRIYLRHYQSVIFGSHLSLS